MKTITITILAIISLMVISCKKDNTGTDLTNQVIGTYNGTLTQGAFKSGLSQAKTDVTKDNDYTVRIHCNGVELDTTFMLELYENGNQMMVCLTGDDFYNEYGHHQSENHYMMGEDGNWTNWEQHTGNDHESGDVHYGSFNMDNHSFEYTFNMHNSQGDYTLHFTGTKQ